MVGEGGVGKKKNTSGRPRVRIGTFFLFWPNVTILQMTCNLREPEFDLQDLNLSLCALRDVKALLKLGTRWSN